MGSKPTRMATLRAMNMHNPIVSPPISTTNGTTLKPTVVFTTPPSYADRFSHLLTLKGHNPLWCPTIVTESNPRTLSALKLHLSPQSVSQLSAVAFPSRTAIAAFSAAVSDLDKPLLPPDGGSFIVSALGRDAELIDQAFMNQLCLNIDRIKLSVPRIATPSGLVQSMGRGCGRKVLCPVPFVVGLEEPPVVPNFLQELEVSGWVPIRVDAYETRWVGSRSAEGMIRKSKVGGVDAVVFTSSGEVEGLLKSLRSLGWDWGMVRRRWPSLVVAAHGPVTAAGAEKLGVDVDVVSSKFSSFEGVVNAIDSRLRGLD